MSPNIASSVKIPDYRSAYSATVPSQFEYKDLVLNRIGVEYRIGHFQIAAKLGIEKSVVKKAIVKNSEQFEIFGDLLMLALPEDSSNRSKHEIFLNVNQASSLLKAYIKSRHSTALRGLLRVAFLMANCECVREHIRESHYDWCHEGRFGIQYPRNFYNEVDIYFDYAGPEETIDRNYLAETLMDMINHACAIEQEKVSDECDQANISTAIDIVLLTLEIGAEGNYGYRATMDIVKRRLKQFSGLIGGSFDDQLYSS